MKVPWEHTCGQTVGRMHFLLGGTFYSVCVCAGCFRGEYEKAKFFPGLGAVRKLE